MPVVGSRAPQGELIRLQEELFDEVQKDSAAIAPHIFGDVDNQPDLGSVPNTRLDDIYRQAYQRNDREFLQREARRDPEQFLKVAQRIGARPAPPNTVVQPNALAQGLAQQAAGAPPMPMPMAPPGMPALPAAPIAPPGIVPPVPAAPPPIILGPNGQPLPPTGLA